MKPDFRKILEKHSGYDHSGMYTTYIDDYSVDGHLEDVLNAMKEVWNLAVEKCAETAEVYADHGGITYVDNESILKNKI